MSSDQITDILQYYSTNNEQNRHQQQQLEFALMSRVLTTYLSNKQCKILEIGAGAGFYTAKLAKMGHEVSAVEPVEKLQKVSQKHCQTLNVEDQVSWHNIEAQKITEYFSEEQFDVILNMGPLYHLIQEEDRIDLMKKCHRLLKPNGLYLSVFLSRLGYLSYVLSRHPEALLEDPEGFKDVLTVGYEKQHPRGGTFRGYFMELKELLDLHTSTGWNLQKLHVLDPAIGGNDETFNNLSDELKEAWLEVLFSLSTNPSLWNSGRTWLSVSIKSSAS